MPRDDDRLLDEPGLSFGSGVVGVCDVCGRRQAVIVLQKERFKLCVLDFLNKAWLTTGAKPGAPLPLYTSSRIWFPTDATPDGKAPAILLVPTKAVRHPALLVTPDVYGLTTSVLDGAIRLAREGFEVLLPDVGKTASVGPRDHLALRVGARFRGGVPVEAPRVAHLVRLYRDALADLRGREMVDPEKTGLLGLSYGGALAAIVAGQERGVSAVAVVYPPPIRPPEYLKLVAAPVLFVDAGADPASRAARGQYAAAAARSEVAVAYSEHPGARHHFLARDLGAYDVRGAEAAWRDIATFLRERLMPPPPRPPPPPVRTTAPPAPNAAAPAPAA